VKRSHPFRFVKRNSKRGRIYYVIYDHDPAHPKATGVLVDPADKNRSFEAAGYDDAVAYAYANLEVTRSGSQITLREFAQHFFDPERCTWTRRMLRKEKRFHASYLEANRGRLKHYILPRFGAVPLNLISAKAIDEWLMDLDSVMKGIPLSPASLDKLLVAIRKILGEAKYQGYIKENVAYEIAPFNSGNRQVRQPFTMQEIKTLFPENFDDALEIWQNLDWYAFFLMQWTCGLRPAETAGFMLSDWIKEYHGAVIQRSVETRTLEIKGLKTEHSGMTVKPVVFSESLEKALTMLEFRGALQDDLLFRSIHGKPIGTDTSNKHFKASAGRGGVELHGRTQYCLRHTFYTEALKRMPEKEVEKMAGHKSLRKEYDHRKGIDFLRAAQPLRDVINELSA